MTHRKVMQFIGTLRDSHPDMVNIFTMGSCINLFFLLRISFPGAIAYYNVDHVITKIGDRFYDITGCVPGDGYLPLMEIYSKKGVARAIKQMSRAHYNSM